MRWYHLALIAVAVLVFAVAMVRGQSRSDRHSNPARIRNPERFQDKETL